ncbi:hypothetical protein BCY88_16675 [Paraburkholderia fungorum]|uniref:Molecular chaperone n=2 Tax=Paraburkholderia fungorum TaxID=134537 RepID=A0A3R7HRX9_9BURK|nr:hypothetical protein BCY88_16675 [Paraburkholderia fungorum]
MIGTSAEAGVVMHGTRVIYPAEQNFVTVRLANQDKAPHLVQTWVDDGKGAPAEDAAGAPFVVMPPLFRIAAEGQQSVRVMFSPNAELPTDRESLYWFNFLQIPPDDRAEQKEGTARIAISFLNQVKLLYRPPGIKGAVGDLPDHLEFRLNRVGKGWQITAKNPTGFYATFQDSARIRSGAEALPIDFGGEVTLAPFSSITWRVASEKTTIASPTIEFSLIDDSSNLRSVRRPVETLR